MLAQKEDKFMDTNSWKAPETEPNPDELKKNIPDLENPYWYHEGYVYYVTDDVIPITSYLSVTNKKILQVRCDGKKTILLYIMEANSSWDKHDLKIKEVKDGYVYFWQYHESSDEYSSGYTSENYRVKTDKSRNLQILNEKSSGSVYTGDTHESENNFDPPKDVDNPAKKFLLFKEGKNE